MSVSSESVHRLLRPAQPLAVVVLLAQICTGTLVVTLTVLASTHLAAFDLSLVVASGTALLAIAVLDAERDRTILPRESWPTLRSRAFVWGAVVLFASGPLVFVALIVDRFAPPSVVLVGALALSTTGWGLAAYTKLRVHPFWLPRPRDEEAELGTAIGALFLTAIIVAAWVLTLIDQAFGNGPSPSSLTQGGSFLLSMLASLVAASIVLVPLMFKRALRQSSSTATQVAFGVVAVPLALLVLLPMARWGHAMPAFVPAYTAESAGRVFLAAVLALTVVEFFRQRSMGDQHLDGLPAEPAAPPEKPAKRAPSGRRSR